MRHLLSSAFSHGHLRLVLVVFGLGTLLGATLVFYLFTNWSGFHADTDEQQLVQLAVKFDQQKALEDRIHTLCTACHVFPPPASFPRAAWYKEVKQGFEFASARGMDLAHAPSFQEVLDYFEQRATDRLPRPFLKPATPSSSVHFETTAFGRSDFPPEPWVSHVRYARLSPPHEQVITVCDMRNGVVMMLNLKDPDRGLQVVARVPNPAHAEPVDLDQDGYMDLLVADLGSLWPDDHTQAQVVWLRRDPHSENYEPIVLAQGLPRVADAQAADFDGDGDLDIVVAAFGWRAVGEILYLENVTTDWAHPQFRVKTLERKTGAIHVPIADLNGDGKPDFVALISQEHEQIVAFLNDGHGNFHQELIFAAADPAYGSTGIQLVDFDQDGDLDVLYTNGDSLDSGMINPYHGIQWLENEGKFPFRYHHLATMPGAHRALAGDVDGDGDLDVVAVSFLPKVDPLLRDPELRELPALLWLENQGGGKFVYLPLEIATCDHATLDLADIDGDGRLDLIVGNFSAKSPRGEPTLAPMKNWLTLWKNQLRRP